MRASQLANLREALGAQLFCAVGAHRGGCVHCTGLCQCVHA